LTVPAVVPGEIMKNVMTRGTGESFRNLFYDPWHRSCIWKGLST